MFRSLPVHPPSGGTSFQHPVSSVAAAESTDFGQTRTALAFLCVRTASEGTIFTGVGYCLQQSRFPHCRVPTHTKLLGLSSQRDQGRHHILMLYLSNWFLARLSVQAISSSLQLGVASRTAGGRHYTVLMNF